VRDVPAPGSILTARQLNRALLARQWLLERQSRPVAEALEHLAGMQSQVPRDPFTGLWTRLQDFLPEQLDRLMLGREAVRLTLMRGTIHLVTARDALAMRPVLQSMLERSFGQTATHMSRLGGLDLEEVRTAIRALLDERPLSRRQLGERLAERWPGRPADALAAVVLLEPVVQVTPRGTWAGSMHPTLTTLAAWLSRDMDPSASVEDVIRRYLRAFGPASVADMQTWSGMTGLRDVVQAMRPELVTFFDERGRELVDLPGLPLPDPEVAAPVRFLPGFDNILLSHADRSRIIADEHRKQLWTKNGLVAPTFLVDGRVAGWWRHQSTKTEASITVTPFAALGRREPRAVEEEAGRLLGFLHPGGATGSVRIESPAGG
jgi:hypothetical protein